jgi:hypothetical protein
MAKGSPGADSSAPVNTQIGGKTLVQLATDLYGSKPTFWGRYFTSTSSTGTVEYRHRKENRILRDNNIRVLSIARQTKNVNGTQADGSSDAEDNAEDVITTFGADYLASIGGSFYVFLDVEGAPSLAQAYYSGWAQTLVGHSMDFSKGKVQLLPCVYATQSDDVTWHAVVDAATANVSCNGAWIARWRRHGCSGLLEWDDDIVLPNVDLPCSVLLWQYADDCHGGGGFDCDQTNPGLDLEKDILNRLILPPEDEDN